MLKSKKILQGVMVLAASVILSYGTAAAQHSHNHGAAPASKMEHQGMKGNPVPDTYDAKQNQAIMVMIKSLASKETIKDANVTITIISPAGKQKTSKAPWCGDHYGESFSPSEKGTYQIVITVVGSEGKGEAIFKYQSKV